MLLGILSDSHDHVEPVRAALKLFDSLGVEFMIHCGDVGGTEVFDQLAGRPLAFVWGNTDEPDDGLERYVQAIGIALPSDPPLTLELAGKTLALFHGHERAFLKASALAGVDYILHGHTHVARNEQRGRVRYINPGALHRTPRKSVATLDLEIDRVEFYEI